MPSSSDEHNFTFRIPRDQLYTYRTLRGAKSVTCEYCSVHIRYQYGPTPQAFCDSCGLKAALKSMTEKEKFLEKIPEEWGEVCP